MRPIVLSFLCSTALGCSTASQVEPRTARTANGTDGAGAKLSWLESRAVAQEQRITELETRLSLLELEGRSFREATAGKPRETVRIGEGRRQDREQDGDEGDREVGEDMDEQPLIRVQVDPPAPKVLEPLVLPEPPPGVSTRLPVVPLPGERLSGEQAPSGVEIQSRYRVALGHLRGRRYEEAIVGFGELLTAAPEGTLADRALYWRGECHYALRSYRRALADFEALVARHPKSSKLPDSILKIGLCHLRLGDSETAAAHFRRVRTEYPNSDAARIAAREGSS
ncbi:MAG: tol-pal system protein YbgF [Myxococcales bacterium]|nr:tol-pal system protein YbgF [Myxococcales bacterium]